MYTTKKIKEGWIVLSADGKQVLIAQATKQDAVDVANWFNAIQKEK